MPSPFFLSVRKKYGKVTEESLESNNSSLAEVLEHIDFSRKVGQSKIPDIKLRHKLISHFSNLPAAQ
jgi:hypothetical protein